MKLLTHVRSVENLGDYGFYVNRLLPAIRTVRRAICPLVRIDLAPLDRGRPASYCRLSG